MTAMTMRKCIAGVRGMKKSAARAIFVLAVLSAPGAGAASPADLAGVWFTEGHEHGNDEQIVFHRASGGGFWEEVRIINDCVAGQPWREAGTWSVADGAIVQTTSSVGGAPSDFHDVYRIVSQAANRYEMLDTEDNVRWTVMRVGADFKFPPPDCGPKTS
jgi:hypothetical protein